MLDANVLNFADNAAIFSAAVAFIVAHNSNSFVFARIILSLRTTNLALTKSIPDVTQFDNFVLKLTRVVFALVIAFFKVSNPPLICCNFPFRLFTAFTTF